MRRIAYQPASASSGGGGAPTVGSLLVGPEYGEVSKPALAVHVAMPEFGFTANRAVGAAIRLSATEFSGGRSVAAHVGLDGGFTNNRSVAVSVALPAVAFEGGRSAGVAIRLSATEFSGGRSAAAHLGATYLGAPIFQTSSTFTTNANVSSALLTKPSGTVDTDLLVAILGASGTRNWTLPSGWTQQLASTGTPSLMVAYRLASSEPADYTFTMDGSAGSIIGTMMRISAVDQTTPIDVSGVTSAGSAADPIAPSITTTVVNTLKIACCSQNALALAATYTPPASYTEISDLTSNLVAVPVIQGEVATRAQPATGASGTATMNSSQLTATAYAAAHIAIRPGVQVLQS